MDEEMQSLQLDRPVAGKSAIQLQKHSIDNQYNNKPIERSLYILTKGDDLQKLSVIEALPELLRTDHQGTVSRIIPKIQQELPNSSSEFHIATSQIFKLLIEMNLSLNLMRPVLQGIESKDPIVASAWVGTLLEVVHSLSEAVLKNEVIPYAMKMSQINRNIFYRVSSCKLLSQIAIHPKMTTFDVRRDILPLVQSLCQDCLYEVRAAMCAELPNIAKGLGSDNVVKSSLLPCLVELSSDENMSVRAAAVNTVVLLIPYLNADTVKNTIIPLVIKLCVHSCKEGDHTFPTVAKGYGLLLNNLQNNMSDLDSVWFLDFFKDLTKKGLHIDKEELEIDPSLSVQCREYCALNLPAVMAFAVSRVHSELGKCIDIFKNLAGDPCYLVRKTVAAGIHEITRILEKENKCIIVDIVKLLRDDSEEVLDALVPNIGSTLEILANNGILTKENTTQITLDIGRALLKCQIQVFQYNNWRRKMSFLEQLEHLPYMMPPDFIHQHFTPVILKLSMEAMARPVRTQAARTILFFLRYSTKDNHRKWIRENLINSLCNSTSCYTRHIFINMCAHAVVIFSWKYFKEHFYLPLLSLGDDPVSTVRLCVVNLCPILKQMLILPIDRQLQVRLENFVSKIEVMEKDKEVLATLRCKLKEMRSAQVNKQETLVEERRKIEEEDKILQGKSTATGNIQSFRPSFSARPVKDSPHPLTQSNSSRVTVLQKKTSQFTKSSSSSSLNDMSFLDQHFYTDAGVALPERVENRAPSEENVVDVEENLGQLKLNKSEAKRHSDEEMIPTVSVENTNIENMSDEDLKELETSTTNITDDVKANLQKITKSKSLSKLSTDTVRRRNKRYSCIFPTDHSQSLTKNTMKRRSLNIGTGEVSRIPVSFRTKKSDEKSNVKSKTGSNRSNTDIQVGLSRTKVSLKPETNENGHIHTDEEQNNTSDIKKCSVDDTKMNNSNIVNTNDVKENEPVNSSIKSIVPNSNNKKPNSAKVSCLPILTRKSRLEIKK